MILPNDPERLEQQLADMLADGTITDETAEEIRTFAEFLRLAGPTDGGASDGRTPGQRLRDAGREDLIAWARRERAEECTGVAAQWCPNHGTCTCPRVSTPGSPGDRPTLEDPGCPLHSPHSDHAEPIGGRP